MDSSLKTVRASQSLILVLSMSIVFPILSIVLIGINATKFMGTVYNIVTCRLIADTFPLRWILGNQPIMGQHSHGYGVWVIKKHFSGYGNVRCFLSVRPNVI
jgi:hypothetical protein